MQRLLSALAVAFLVVLVACSTDSGGAADSGTSPVCDDNNGPCAPQCIPYALCTSEGSTCVIGGAACGHYWICHDATWVSDTAQDCDTGTTAPDASLDAAADATVDAPFDSTAADATDGSDGGGDDAPEDGALPDGDDGG